MAEEKLTTVTIPAHVGNIPNKEYKIPPPPKGFKPTVLKDGPGAVADRRARMHDALDAVLDRKARAGDVGPFRKDQRVYSPEHPRSEGTVDEVYADGSLKISWHEPPNPGMKFGQRSVELWPPSDLGALTAVPGAAYKKAAKDGSELRKAKAGDAVNFDYGRGRSKELDAALDAIKNAYAERDAAAKLKEAERAISAANAVWRKLDSAFTKANGGARDEYHFAKPSAKPRPLMSVTSKEDLAKMAAKGGSELHKKKTGDSALKARLRDAVRAVTR